MLSKPFNKIMISQYGSRRAPILGLGQSEALEDDSRIKAPSHQA